MFDVSSIDPPADRLRDRIDQAELQKLAASLGSVSLLSPLSVTPVNEPGQQRYQLVCGERRWRAAKLAGWRMISAYVVVAPRAVLLEMAMIENLQREQLNVIEEARAVDLLTRPTIGH
jgi:ParB family transcriptional regulator, chromosome partitioning protein